jgi:hypothetical protein
MPFASVEIRAGLVYKHGPPKGLEMEAFRTCLAAALGESSGLFSVPRVVLSDPAGGTLVTQFVPNLMNLHEIALKDADQEEVFRAAGMALATVHRELQLPTERILALPDYLRSAPEDEVALHGDFCWSNVCWERSQRKIVLLDWATAPLLGRVATYGCRYFDLLWFSWSLFFWTPPRRFLQWRPERLIRVLAQGYAEVEKRFQWRRYIEYRSAMRSLPFQYWQGKRAVVPSAPHYTCAELLGWLRWRLFPMGWTHIVRQQAGRKCQTSMEAR